MKPNENLLDKDLKPSFREACVELEKLVYANIHKLRSQGEMEKAKKLELCWHTMKVGA
tara:strand:- start:262 stop:435 length:174 start_codon:yes stop_codon:yes gene_type:complete